MSSPLKTEQYSPFRWFVLVTLFVVTATTALGLISPAPLIGAIVTEPGQTLSAGQITWMTMGWFNLAVAISALLGGFFVDRFGFVWIYAVGATLVGLGWVLVAFGLGDSYGGMMTIRALQGVGTGPVMASAAAVAALRFPVHERSIVTGTQGAGMAAGIGIGQALMPQLLSANDGDWQAALGSLWPVSLVALLLTAVVAFGPKPERIPVGDLSEAERYEMKHALATALRHPVTWAAIACVFILSWVFQAFNDLTPAYLTSEAPLGLDMASGGTLLAVAQVFNFLGAFAAGAFTEKIMRGRVRPGIVMGFSLGAVFGLGMLLPAATGSPAIMGITLAIAAFFFAWINPNALGYFAKTYPANIVGKLGGYAMGLGIFGGTLGVAAGSAALHATDQYTLSIVIMSGVCAFGIVPALFLRQGKGDAGTGASASRPRPTSETTV